MNKYHKRIVDYLMKNPGKYIDMNEMIMALSPSNNPNNASTTMIYRAYQDLIANGRVVINGNAIKINQ